MEPKDSQDNDGQGETSGAQGGILPARRTGGVAGGVARDSNEYFVPFNKGIVLNPIKDFLIKGIQPQGELDQTPSAAHQIGGAFGGISTAHQTRVGTNQTHGVAAAHQTRGGVSPPHRTGGTNQSHGASAGHHTGSTNQTHGVGVGQYSGSTNQSHDGVEAGGIQETSNQGGQRRLLMMPKVPTYIRQKYNSEDYDPLVASFGPYNAALHNAPDQRLALVEEFKATALKWFVTGTGKDANFWLDKVWYLVPCFRRCYTQESLGAYSNAELTQMFFQDACLAILVMGVANEEHQEIKLLYDHLGAATVVTIIRDSFLLENQLPFWFIRDLLHRKFGFFKGEARWRKHFMVLCHGSTKSRKDTSRTVYWDEEAGEPAHFVEALKIAHLSGWKRENSELKHHTIEEEERIIPLKDYYAIHSVTELKAKGINVEPNSTNSFKNITFQSKCFSGTLQFPVDFVNYGSKAAYANIIAYEMSPANHTQDYTMTSYVHLMKSLLQSPKDVEELQASGIIINMLGSNEQVINLYRDIYTFGANCSSKYGEICHKMEDHYNNKTKTWLAELLHTYFSSPWTVIALFGSVLVLTLTFMQVYYAATEANKGDDKGK